MWLRTSGCAVAFNRTALSYAGGQSGLRARVKHQHKMPKLSFSQWGSWLGISITTTLVSQSNVFLGSEDFFLLSSEVLRKICCDLAVDFIQLFSPVLFSLLAWGGKGNGGQLFINPRVTFFLPWRYIGLLALPHAMKWMCQNKANDFKSQKGNSASFLGLGVFTTNKLY